MIWNEYKAYKLNSLNYCPVYEKYFSQLIHDIIEQNFNEGNIALENILDEFKPLISFRYTHLVHILRMHLNLNYNLILASQQLTQSELKERWKSLHPISYQYMNSYNVRAEISFRLTLFENGLKKFVHKYQDKLVQEAGFESCIVIYKIGDQYPWPFYFEFKKNN